LSLTEPISHFLNSIAGEPALLGQEADNPFRVRTLSLERIVLQHTRVQEDVSNFAKILTGWMIRDTGSDPDHGGEFVFLRRAHQPGSQNVIGNVYPDTGLGQGRAVLAVPGPITSPTSQGCNKLIQQGAKPALCPGDVLEELGLPFQDCSGQRPGVNPPARAAPPDLSPLQRTLWEALAAESKHVDVLVADAGAVAGDVLTALTELELRGLVRQEPGMVFGWFERGT